MINDFYVIIIKIESIHKHIAEESDMIRKFMEDPSRKIATSV